MKRFRFTLQAVQTVRERASREAMELYARTLRARIEAEAALVTAETALSTHLTDWRAAMKIGFAPSDMLQQEHMRTMLEARRNERAQQLKQATAEANQAYAAFQLARQKNEVVERFQERQRAAFNFNVLKEEQHVLDELAATRRDSGLFEKGFAHA